MTGPTKLCSGCYRFMPIDDNRNFIPYKRILTGVLCDEGIRTYTFKRYMKGKMIDIVQAEGESMSDAISTLSDNWPGVFLFVNKIPYQ